MKDIAMKRATVLGEYIAENNATVREAARVYRVSKSTVHKDVTERLAVFAPVLAARVKEVLERNKSERHMRKTQIFRAEKREETKRIYKSIKRKSPE